MRSEFWCGKRVFITGHTGFKGSWLSLWLQALGSEVGGLSLAPSTDPNLYGVARVEDGMISFIGDIRNPAAVQAALVAFRPEIVFHLAAQPLVRLSYAEPVETYATNVMGTVHLLDAARRVSTIHCIVNVTTDKCYDNREWEWGYRENDPMGGHDPYSSSKGCSELITAAYRTSFFSDSGVALASARAGNVIGGGDWAVDRLIPDILHAFERDQPVVIRHPHSTRPWQHVLEPLGGYMMLAERLWHDGSAVAESWNFGPEADDARPVSWIVDGMASRWNARSSTPARWSLDAAPNPHEARFLKLDISKARHRLGWRPVWRLSDALDQIDDWHAAWQSSADMRVVCLRQIDLYATASQDLPAT